VVAAEDVLGLADPTLTAQAVTLVADRLRACGVAAREAHLPVQAYVAEALVAVSVRRRADSLRVSAVVSRPAGTPRLTTEASTTLPIQLPHLVDRLMGLGLAQLCPAR
jgi:hypothetical protein